MMINLYKFFFAININFILLLYIIYLILKEEKKKFDRETERVYGLVESHMKTSHKKKDTILQEVSFLSWIFQYLKFAISKVSYFIFCF